MIPGIAVCAAGVALSWGIHQAFSPVATMTAAVVLGVLAANLGLVSERARPGLDAVGPRLMRWGVVLLGLDVSLGQIRALGIETVLMAIGVVVLTFTGTRWLGEKIGLSPGVSRLVAAGYAVCGCSAIAAMKSDEEEHEVVTAMALVTLCGSLAVGVLPLLGHLFGMRPELFGRWAGASVHDVGQVVAAASIAGSAALAPAIAVKLIRVMMLVPMVAMVSGRRRGLPLFVVGFVALLALRTTGWLPAGVLQFADIMKELAFAAGLFVLGTAVRFSTLRKTGVKALALGLASWLLVASVALGGVLLTS